MQGMVLFAVFPQGYFAWQGYNFWSGVADVTREGYAQDGIWGGFAAGLGQIANVFVPVVDAGRIVGREPEVRQWLGGRGPVVDWSEIDISTKW